MPKFPSVEFADSITLPTPAPHSPVVPELNSVMHFPMLLPFSPVCQLLKPETHIFVPGTPVPHTMVNTGTFLSNSLMDSGKDDQSANYTAGFEACDIIFQPNHCLDQPQEVTPTSALDSRSRNPGVFLGPSLSLDHTPLPILKACPFYHLPLGPPARSDMFSCRLFYFQ